MADLSLPGPQLTPEVARKFIAALRTGLFKDAAAQSIGILPQWIDDWVEMGLTPGAVEPYATFARGVVATEVAEQVPVIAAWKAAASIDWKAGASYLAARYPAQWGPKATRTRQLGDLQPTARDVEADEQLVEQLVEAEPEALVRILERKGWTKGPTPGKPE
jgi:hypothetical protein